MCLSPITIRVNGIDGTRSIQVPCGKCVECLKTKQNDYMVRIYEEMMNVSKSCFLTLTYAPQNIPYFDRNGKRFFTVWKKDVQDWIKRFRTNYERKTGIKNLRYFLCSEYGPVTHRPHYHVLFFGLGRSDLEMAINDWSSRFGYVMAKDVKSSPADKERSARYVSKYACKGLFEDPFRSSGEGASLLSPFQQRSWSYLCKSLTFIPFVFVLSSVPALQLHTTENILFKFSGCLFGRGFEA